MPKFRCPICQSPADGNHYGGSSVLQCLRCGEYTIGSLAARNISIWTQLQRINLSGWVRENQKCELSWPVLEGLATLRTPTIGEKAQKLLEIFAIISPKAGSKFGIFTSPEKSKSVGEFLFGMAPNAAWPDFVHPQFLAWSWSEDFEELAYLLNDFLISEIGAIEFLNDGNFRITPKGWSLLNSARFNQGQSRIAFIAMWFDESMNDTWLALEKGIRDAGYEPLRIDQKQHNNKIDDEIVAAIRRSKFIVADFTKQRGGVYFEAGFARGLNLEVIWLCRQGELQEVHFDTRQYNFIVWEAHKLAELSKNLQNRIEATIGHGPL